jgi:hypothetical protein
VLDSKLSKDFVAAASTPLKVGALVLYVKSGKIDSCMEKSNAPIELACNTLSENLNESSDGLCKLKLSPKRAPGAPSVCASDQRYFINEEGLIDCKPIAQASSCGEQNVSGTIVSRGATGMQSGMALCVGQAPPPIVVSGPNDWKLKCKARCNSDYPAAPGSQDSSSEAYERLNLCYSHCENNTLMNSLMPAVANVTLPAPNVEPTEISQPQGGGDSPSTSNGSCLCGSLGSISQGSICTQCYLGRVVQKDSNGVDILMDKYIRTMFKCEWGLLRYMLTDYSESNRCPTSGMQSFTSQQVSSGP